LVLEGKKKRLLRELSAEMSVASTGMLFEKAARIRDEIKAIESLGLRGNVETDLQPEAFAMDPKQGLVGLRKVLGLKVTPRSIECIDIAHLAGEETVASLVCFIDGMPFKHGYRRYRIKTVQGIDDFASIREAVSRRYGKLGDDSSSQESMPAPDIILIDGGKGQLSAAKEALAAYGVQVSCLISLAKREEEIYTLTSPEPIRLGRNSVALKLLQHARDEAHRFAQHYHHLLRGKKLRDDFKKSQ
jgi:excinuclease ABC subunit C